MDSSLQSPGGVMLTHTYILVGEAEKKTYQCVVQLASLQEKTISVVTLIRTDTTLDQAERPRRYE